MKQIKLYGLGGQGVVTAAKIFAKAVALGENKNALSVPAYGHERRGAPVYSDLFIDENPILLRTFVYDPDIVVVFDLSVIEKGVDVMAGAKADTMFILNAISVPDEFAGKQVRYVDARKISLEVLNRDIPNTTMLGAMAAAGLCSLDSVKSAISSSFGGKAGNLNALSAERGCNELN